MTVLPIVERELRVASRRRGTYWNRAFSATIAVLVFGLMFVLSATEPTRQLGQTLFTVLSVGYLGVSLMMGAFFTADAISEEKREETLGLLFLTDLKAYDVVFGKLVASSVGAIYATLAMLPVLAIPLLLGGVSWGEFARVVLVLVTTMFLSLAAGVMVSSMMRQALVAMGVTLAVVVAVNAIAPLLAVWIGVSTGAQPPEALFIPSVGYALAVAHEPLFKGREAGFLTSVLVMQGLACTFFVLACQRTRYGWQRGKTEAGGGWREQAARWLRGDERRRREWRQVAMEANPCYWLGARLWYTRWKVWAGLGLLILLWLAGFAAWGWSWAADEGVALFSVLVLHTVLRWWIAAEAAMSLGPDRRSGALELLLCTGLSIREIVRGRLLALQRQFLVPSIGVLVIDLWVLMVLLNRSSSAADQSWWLACFAVLALVFLADMVALAWLGLWYSLVARRVTRALLWAGGIVFGLPWALLVGLLILLIVTRADLPPPEWITLLGGYGTVGVGVSLMAGGWARERLLSRLRSVAAGDEAPRPRRAPIPAFTEGSS